MSRIPALPESFAEERLRNAVVADETGDAVGDRESISDLELIRKAVLDRKDTSDLKSLGSASKSYATTTIGDAISGTQFEDLKFQLAAMKLLQSKEGYQLASKVGKGRAGVMKVAEMIKELSNRMETETLLLEPAKEMVGLRSEERRKAFA